MSQMPGVAGKAGNAIQSISQVVTQGMTKFGGIGLLVGGVIAAISAPLIAFFTKSESGMELMERKVSGLKAAWSVLIGEMVNAGDKMTDAFDKPEKKASHFWQTVLTILGSISPALATRWGAVGAEMDSASKAAEDYTKKLQDLRREEVALIVPRAEANAKIKEARLTYADTTKSFTERINALDTSLKLENKVADDEIEHQKRVVEQLKEVNRLKKNAGQLVIDDERKLAEAEAKVMELQGESADRYEQQSKILSNARKELLAEQFRLIEAEGKQVEVGLKKDIDAYNIQKAELKDAYNSMLMTVGNSFIEREALREDYEKKDAELDKQIVEKQKQTLEIQRDLQKKQLDTVIQDQRVTAAQKILIDQQTNAAIALLDEQYLEKQRQQTLQEEKIVRDQFEKDQKIRFEWARLKADDESRTGLEHIEAMQKILDAEYQATVNSNQYKNASVMEQMMIDQQYTDATIQLSQARIEQHLQEASAVSGALSAMSDLVGNQTVLGKAFAIAAATIDTYGAAMKTLNDPTIPSTVARILAMVSIIATGIATVRKIIAVKVPGKGGGAGAAPTAIATSAPVQRAYATAGASTYLTAPNLSQTQVNALPNQNPLTAEDIARAVAKLPAPVVTVEDINKKSAEVKKVEVRATI
jgi:gas vesicle protein